MTWLLAESHAPWAPGERGTETDKGMEGNLLWGEEVTWAGAFSDLAVVN